MLDVLNFLRTGDMGTQLRFDSVREIVRNQLSANITTVKAAIQQVKVAANADKSRPIVGRMDEALRALKVMEQKLGRKRASTCDDILIYCRFLHQISNNLENAVVFLSEKRTFDAATRKKLRNQIITSWNGIEGVLKGPLNQALSVTNRGHNLVTGTKLGLKVVYYH